MRRRSQISYAQSRHHLEMVERRQCLYNIQLILFTIRKNSEFQFLRCNLKVMFTFTLIVNVLSLAPFDRWYRMDFVFIVIFGEKNQFFFISNTHTNEMRAKTNRLIDSRIFYEMKLQLNISKLQQSQNIYEICFCIRCVCVLQTQWHNHAG